MEEVLSKTVFWQNRSEFSDKQINNYCLSQKLTSTTGNGQNGPSYHYSYHKSTQQVNAPSSLYINILVQSRWSPPASIFFHCCLMDHTLPPRPSPMNRRIYGGFGERNWSPEKISSKNWLEEHGDVQLLSIIKLHHSHRIKIFTVIYRQTNRTFQAPKHRFFTS